MISRWEGGAEPLGRHQPPTWALFGKTHAKTKELDPVGGGGDSGAVLFKLQELPFINCGLFRCETFSRQN